MESLIDKTPQEGKIIGYVYDGNFNNIPLVFAKITIKELDKTVKTDTKGAYQISLKSGTYTLAYSFLGYDTTIEHKVKVKNKQTIVLDKTLMASTPQFDFAAIN
jgi:hypothetical protein